MISFIHEDGLGNMMDEDGKDVIIMESGSHLFPVEMITDYDHYMDMKPPERMVVTKAGSDEVKQEDSITPNRKSYRCYKDDEKEELFFLVYEKSMSVRAAALQLQIKPRTAQYWVQQDQKEPKDQIVKNVGGGRPPGRPPKLVEEHRQFLIDLIDEKPSLVLDEIMTSLTEQFTDLDIKKSALHDFMTKKCKISLKWAHFQSVERNNPEKIEDRHAWVTK
ncbi:hypothetical protein G6F57_010358 [Rhizopus arrhizus]|uniref:Homeodomain-like DNA binding domain-containing transcription factor n=1 Tax=Rhizopus oryzae TaxID=64495 RepID=A0A9P6X3J7_RHIOR|nr:hypothetical protein G6F24_012395 [Rhizopus arrhizus]KAG1415350.1 hypothetical protein G6F58_006528 [Rhizopus delemar]KAG0931669.1 hypothetical protein G6F30_011085 [Rhizopus arrhizus]KAG0976017.1 hypothetical protein G6F29_011112 [Rhizopus arrhizus]KAG0988243.1 hypothetical protein G6F28_009831 [Rhizopus arrhizus]